MEGTYLLRAVVLFLVPHFLTHEQKSRHDGQKRPSAIAICDRYNKVVNKVELRYANTLVVSPNGEKSAAIALLVVAL